MAEQADVRRHARTRGWGAFSAVATAVGVALAAARRAPLRRRLLAALAMVVLLAATVMALGGAMTIGVSTDQPGHVWRMSTWFHSGWYLQGNFMEDGQPRDDIATGRLHAYGAGYSAVGHLFAVIAGAESPGRLASTPAAYAARGVVVALLGLAGALAVGYALRVATGSRLVGLWSAAAVMAMPLWTGYGMFAVKDVPAAAGWTMFTAGLVVALHPLGRRRAIIVGLLCGLGVWFSVGVRTALWLPLAGMLVVFGILAWRRWRLWIPVAVGGLLGFVVVAAVHFRNALTPVVWLATSVRTSGDFAWRGSTLTAGQLLIQKPPWWYLPAWIGGSVPLLILVLALVGLVVAARGLFARSSRGSGAILWALQAAALPIMATVAGSTMYAGLRQHVYVLPALAALAGLCVSRLMSIRVVGPALLALALIFPLADQASLYPYQFAYKNVLAAPVNDRWETDMHWVSSREALSQVPPDVTVYCYTNALIRDPDPRPFSECRGGQISPFLGNRPEPAGEDVVWVLGRRYRGSDPPPGCTDAGSITRRLRGETIVLSYVLRCTVDPPADPEP